MTGILEKEIEKKINVLIAPNAFKGSLSSLQASEVIKAALKPYRLLHLSAFPIADGGDGTLDVLVHNLNGEYRESLVHDPLGRKIDAKWGIISGNVAVIEMANASGIKLLKKEERNPLHTNTLGTGELIMQAVEEGLKKVILCIGGSATVDGGAGILRAFGARFYDRNKEEIIAGNLLKDLGSLETNAFDARLKDVQIEVLTDVENPLLGKTGAAKVFGPQKGADILAVDLLEGYMNRYSEIIKRKSGRDYSTMEGAGAAGGIAFTLKSLFNATVRSGFDFVADQLNLVDKIKASDVVITGEGKIDEQTLHGKGPGKIASLAKELQKFCIGICGTYEWREEMDQYFDMIIPVNQSSFEDMPLENEENLRRMSSQLGSCLSYIIEKVQ